MAGRPAHDDVDRPRAKSRAPADLLPREFAHVLADHLSLGEVKLVNGGVDRVVLDCGSDIEPRLLEAEREAPSASEEIDADRTIAVRVHVFFCS